MSPCCIFVRLRWRCRRARGRQGRSAPPSAVPCGHPWPPLRAAAW